MHHPQLTKSFQYFRNYAILLTVAEVTQGRKQAAEDFRIEKVNSLFL